MACEFEFLARDVFLLFQALKMDRTHGRYHSHIGHAALARLSISPFLLMPASTTAAVCSGPRLRTVMGRPIRLLKLR